MGKYVTTLRLPTLAPAALVALLLACAGTPERDPGALAAAYAEAGRFEEAAREIELAVRSAPRDTSLRLRAARIHAQSEAPGALERAVGHLEMALQADPSDAEIWIALGELETVRENVGDAYVAYRRAAEIAPDDIRAVSGLALAADSLGLDREAERAYARWAEIERDLGLDGPDPPDDPVPASPLRW